MKNKYCLLARLIKKKKKKNAKCASKKEERIQSSLRYFRDLGKVNHPIKLKMKILCTSETDMKNQFQSNRQMAAIAAPDAKATFNEASFVQYEQIQINDNFRQYVKVIVISKKPFKWAYKNHCYKNPFTSI